MSKSKLYWVSVGGNPCEPARIVDDTVFTIGCPDGTELTEDCGIELVEEMTEIPLTPAGAIKAEKAWRRKVARDRKNSIHHGYRRF